MKLEKQTSQFQKSIKILSVIWSTAPWRREEGWRYSTMHS